jgi:hypothetical protein
MATMIHQKVSFTASPCELFTIYLDSQKHGPAVMTTRRFHATHDWIVRSFNAAGRALRL